MKKTLFVLICLAAMMVSCHKDTQLEQKDPKVTEDQKEIEATKVTFTWEVDYPGKLISVVEVSPNEDMSEAESYGSEDFVEQKRFQVTVHGLTEITKYYYRFKVWNSTMNYQTEVKSFRTVVGYLPTVSTATVVDITLHSATGGGNVTDDGGADIIERGICWSTEPNPSIENDHDYDHEQGGVGNFTINMQDLEDHVTYYVRAYATNCKGTSYGAEVSFETRPNIILATNEVVNITQYTAVGGGDIIYAENNEITERGICWSTEPSPTIDDAHECDHGQIGLGTYTVDMTDLQNNTTYYVRAYAINSQGLNYGNEMTFTTLPNLPAVITYEVSFIAHSNARCSGKVVEDWEFDVTERGVCWSTSHNPTIGGSYVYDHDQAGFGSYTVMMTGLHPNTTYYVRAYAVCDQGVGYGNEVSFTTRSLDGCIDGVFSVSDSKKVHFSRGNLQYRASTNSWRFASNQYDRIGEANANTSQDYDGWVDLFGWGTSGHNHGAVCYQPWSVSQNNNDYYAYGNLNYNLYDQNGQADWGSNAISNGGDADNLWRTLSKEEWVYVLNTRSTTSDLRYAKAIVDGVSGLILLPDDWATNYAVLYNCNSSSGAYGNNTINNYDWYYAFQNHGAVFLPAAGRRDGTLVNYVDVGGYYWSANCNSDGRAYFFNFNSSYVVPNSISVRHNGCSVRLVHDLE